MLAPATAIPVRNTRLLQGPNLRHLLELISTKPHQPFFYDAIRSITSETLGIGALAGTLMIEFGTKSLHEQIEPNWCHQLNAMINNKFRSFSTPLIIDRSET